MSDNTVDTLKERVATSILKAIEQYDEIQPLGPERIDVIVDTAIAAVRAWDTENLDRDIAEAQRRQVT